MVHFYSLLPLLRAALYLFMERRSSSAVLPLVCVHWSVGRAAKAGLLLVDGRPGKPCAKAKYGAVVHFSEPVRMRQTLSCGYPPPCGGRVA